MPLDSIGGKKGTFVKSLHAAGSRILKIQEEADELASSQNVRFEQDVSEPRLSAADIIDRQNAADVIDRQNAANIIDRQKATDPDLSLLATLNDETSDDEDDETDDADVRLLAGKFVNFTDLLPPLPAKGNFKVEAIKGSQYFFS